MAMPPPQDDDELLIKDEKELRTKVDKNKLDASVSGKYAHITNGKDSQL
ncbi:MAG TPA: hypothetical protein VGI28_08405 [Stellaceae bacterium]